MRKFGIYGLFAAVGSLALLATTTGCNNREASAAAATVAPRGAGPLTLALAKNVETEVDGLVLIDRSVYRDPPASFDPVNAPFPAENFYNCLIHSIEPDGATMRYHAYTVTCPRGKTLNLPRSSNFLARGEAANTEKLVRYMSDRAGGLKKGCVLGMEQPIDADLTVYEVVCSDDSDVFALWKASDFKIDKRLESRFDSFPL